MGPNRKVSAAGILLLACGAYDLPDSRRKDAIVQDAQVTVSELRERAHCPICEVMKSVVEGASGSVWIYYRCGLHRCTRKRAAMPKRGLWLKVLIKRQWCGVEGNSVLPDWYVVTSSCLCMVVCFSQVKWLSFKGVCLLLSAGACRVSGAELDRCKPRDLGMCWGVCTKTRHGRREIYSVAVDWWTTGILEFHETRALKGARTVWV